MVVVKAPQATRRVSLLRLMCATMHNAEQSQIQNPSSYSDKGVFDGNSRTRCGCPPGVPVRSSEMTAMRNCGTNGLGQDAALTRRPNSWLLNVTSRRTASCPTETEPRSFGRSALTMDGWMDGRAIDSSSSPNRSHRVATPYGAPSSSSNQWNECVASLQ